MAIEHVAKSPKAPDANDAKKGMTEAQASDLLKSIAQRVQGLTMRTRKEYVYIARYTRKWGRWKLANANATNAECISAIETEYDLQNVKLDVGLIRRSFAVLPDWRKAEKLGKVKEFFACTTQEQVDALLQKKVTAPTRNAKTGIAGKIAAFQKTLANCVKKNDVEALRVFAKVAADALATVEGKRKRKAPKIENGAVVNDAPKTSAPEKPAMTPAPELTPAGV